MPIVVLWRESKVKTSLADFLKQQEAAAILNLTHIQQGKKLINDFQQLNIPILQGLHFGGNAQQWNNAPSGVAQHLNAIFIALPETWGISDPLVLSIQEGDQEKWLVPQVNLLLDKVIAQSKLKFMPNSSVLK